MTQLVIPHSIDAGTEITALEHQDNYTAIRDVINGGIEGGTGASGNIKANGITARELADVLFSRGLPGAGLMQEGIVGAGEGKVTPGAGLVLNYASGSGWITDDSGILAATALLPVVITGSTVTIGNNSSGNPRIDQIVATLTGHNVATVSIVQGTPTVGATLDNRSGAAALPGDSIRLADILMPNAFAGPFVQNTHIRDRRQWARGAFAKADDAVGTTTTSTSYAEITALTMRIECTGVPIRLIYAAPAATDFIDNIGSLELRQDGSSLTPQLVGDLESERTSISSQTMVVSGVLVPSAGSHVFGAYLKSSIAAKGFYLGDDARAGSLQQFSVEELLRPNEFNSGA